MKHPLARALARCAALRIERKLLRPREAKEIMRLVADCDAALAVVLSVADSASLIDIMVDDLIIRSREDFSANDGARSNY